MAKRVTLGDVASAAGLSTGAVSRYLNKSLALPPETGRRIDTAVRTLGYRAHGHARGLNLGRSDTVALVMPEIDNPFFSKLAAAVERAADARGVAVMLCSTANKTAREVRYVEALAMGAVNGLLFATNHHDADGTIAAAVNGAPRIVLLDEDVPGADVAKVFPDNEQGGLLAGRHLIKAGHRRLGYIGGPSDLMSARERAEGLHQAVRESNTDARVEVELFGTYSIEHGVRAGEAILDSHAGVTGVFVGSDEILFGLLQVLAARSREPGADFSLVTFDDIHPLGLLRVPITAVRQPIEAIGRRALELLLDPPSEPRTERLPVELVVRRSVFPRT